MKTIQLQNDPQKQSSNVICLGNGVRVHCTSVRQKTYLLNVASRFLTKCLVSINQTYIECFGEYRQMWFVTVNTRKGTKTNYYQIEQKIKLNLDGCGAVMDKFTGNYGSGSDPYFAFVDLKKCALFLHAAAQTMADFHEKRNHTAGLYKCEMLADRCLATANKLDNFGQTESDIKRQMDELEQVKASAVKLKQIVDRQQQREAKKKAVQGN